MFFENEHGLGDPHYSSIAGQDPLPLICKCKKPLNPEQLSIQCDKCDGWYHGAWYARAPHPPRRFRPTRWPDAHNCSVGFKKNATVRSDEPWFCGACTAGKTKKK